MVGSGLLPIPTLSGMRLQLRSPRRLDMECSGQEDGSQAASFGQLFTISLTDRTIGDVLWPRSCPDIYRDLFQDSCPPCLLDHLTGGKTTPVSAVGSIFTVPSLDSLIWRVMESNVRAIAFGLVHINCIFLNLWVTSQPPPAKGATDPPGLLRTNGVSLMAYAQLS